MNIRKYKRLRLPDRKKFWKENPIGGETDINIPGIPTFRMHSTNDDVVVKELYWTKYKGWELTSLQLWKYLTESSDGTVLDIGSYSGIYSLIAAQNEKNDIYAYDIQKVCVKRVEKNSQINDFSNIKVENIGYSDKAGEVIYHYNKEDNFLTSIASLLKRPSHDSTAEVEVKRGDDILDSYADLKSITNIKIDVEDLEKEALIGLTQSIDVHRPNLLIEVLKIKNVRTLLDLLPIEYQCYRINEKRLQVIPFRKVIPNWSIGRNYFFTVDGHIVDRFLQHFQSLKL